MYRTPLKLAYFLLLLGCDSTGPKSTSLLFDGTVTEAATGGVIASADVSVRDFGGSYGLVGKDLQSTRTSSQGRYTLSYNACAGSPALVVYAVGYHPKSVEVGCKAERQAVDISLTRDPLAPSN
ncbi:MAG TPA: carboxypeptidase regulatory-like domain-containing protein [Gemmatimonadaceae bacterium]|nr:carboxypeptidase regulatory-like domain-containing protein [Gemmatimonadaceae bacterium]